MACGCRNYGCDRCARIYPFDPNSALAGAYISRLVGKSAGVDVDGDVADVERPLVFGAGFGGYPTVFDPYHKKRFIEIFQYPHTIVLTSGARPAF